MILAIDDEPRRFDGLRDLFAARACAGRPPTPLAIASCVACVESRIPAARACLLDYDLDRWADEDDVIHPSVCTCGAVAELGHKGSVFLDRLIRHRAPVLLVTRNRTAALRLEGELVRSGVTTTRIRAMETADFERLWVAKLWEWGCV